MFPMEDAVSSKVTNEVSIDEHRDQNGCVEMSSESGGDNQTAYNFPTVQNVQQATHQKTNGNDSRKKSGTKRRQNPTDETGESFTPSLKRQRRNNITATTEMTSEFEAVLNIEASGSTKRKRSYSDSDDEMSRLNPQKRIPTPQESEVSVPSTSNQDVASPINSSRPEVCSLEQTANPEDIVRLRVRKPCGESLTWTMLNTDRVKKLINKMEELKFCRKKFELLAYFPTRNFSQMEANSTLRSVGLKREVLVIRRKLDDEDDSTDEEDSDCDL